MRYFRTSAPNLLKTLQPIAAAIDNCWWHLAGSCGMTQDFVERMQADFPAETNLQEYFSRLLETFVEHNTQIGPVGRPGFFSHLGDILGLHWTCYFAIDGDQLPLTSLVQVDGLSNQWFGPFENLPSDVVLVVRDVDSSYQEYGFRDDWMFNTILHYLRQKGWAAHEITDWPLV